MKACRLLFNIEGMNEISRPDEMSQYLTDMDKQICQCRSETDLNPQDPKPIPDLEIF